MKKQLFLLFTLTYVLGIHSQDIPPSFSLDEAIEWGMEYNRTLQRASLELQ